MGRLSLEDALNLKQNEILIFRSIGEEKPEGMADGVRYVAIGKEVHPPSGPPKDVILEVVTGYAEKKLSFKWFEKP